MAFWGITARNPEQKAAMQLLLNDTPFLFVTGPAGTGKTLISEAVGLYLVAERNKYNKLVYTRLQMQLGGNQGAIPGDFDDKTEPFIKPFLNNFELISSKSTLDYLISGDERRRKVFFEPIQTLRGASFHNSFMIVDKAQNLDVNTIAAIGTRLARDSKIIFIGNFAQIDNKKLRVPEQNGLHRLLEGFYEYHPDFQFFQQINLTVVERHKAVDLVEKILRDNETNPRFMDLEKRGNLENNPWVNKGVG